MKRLWMILKAIFTLRFIPSGSRIKHEQIEELLNTEEDLILWELGFDDFYDE